MKRLPRKLKKKLKNSGVDPKEFLNNLRVYKYRGKHLDIIFDKDYNDSHRIVQEEIGDI